VLLRDAQPTFNEIEGEPDVRKRRERERARDFAIGKLLKMHRDAEKQGSLNQLDLQVRMFCDAHKARNAGVLPKSKGGRPLDEHRRLSIAVHVHEAIEARGRKRGSVEEALREVAERDCVSYDHVRDIYHDPDPEWQSTVAAELSRRRYETGAG
jgi:hypothetical protein